MDNGDDLVCRRCVRLGLSCEFVDAARTRCCLLEPAKAKAGRRATGAPVVDGLLKNTETPIELLREWSLVSVKRNDCELLGRAMTIASAAGHRLSDIFVSPLPVDKILSGAAAHPTASTELPPNVMPACISSWIHDDSRAAHGYPGDRPTQLVLVKRVVNGQATFVTNREFEMHVLPREQVETSWVTKNKPITEQFLHPADAEKASAQINQLWYTLKTTANPGGAEKSSEMKLPGAYRVWVRMGYGATGGYINCKAQFQLVVESSLKGQTSHLVLCFNPSEQEATTDSQANATYSMLAGLAQALPKVSPAPVAQPSLAPLPLPSSSSMLGLSSRGRYSQTPQDEAFWDEVIMLASDDGNYLGLHNEV